MTDELIRNHAGRGKKVGGFVNCPRCGTVRKRGRGIHCKVCYLKARSDRRAAGNMTFRKNEIRYKQTDKGRAQITLSNQRRHAIKSGANGKHTPTEWQAILKKQRNRCAICHIVEKLTVDHIVPLSRGGTDFAFNLQGLCGKCNASKNDRVAPGTQHSLFDDAKRHRVARRRKTPDRDK